MRFAALGAAGLPGRAFSSGLNQSLSLFVKASSTVTA
jgi:hypothetical protein